MAERREFLVVGAGAMGSATAWQLARRGRQVTVVDQFGPGHDRGASHGATRNFNTGYTDPVYQRLVQEAGAGWRELEADSGAELLDLVGLTNHGAGIVPGTAGALRALGVSVTELSPAAAGERWPGIRYDTQVLHIPGAGRIDSARALAALHSRTRARGGEIHVDTRVLSINATARGPVEVVTDSTTYRAGRVIVCAGAWTEPLLRDLTGAESLTLPPLRVTREHPTHFPPRADLAGGHWPSFNHFPAPGQDRYAAWPGMVYGMLTPGEGVKAGWHGVGPVVIPDARDLSAGHRALVEGQAAALAAYAREWLPGVDASAGQATSCTYTSTPDSRFVLKAHGPIVVGAGFSGEGFKFTPAIGRVLADLAMAPMP